MDVVEHLDMVDANATRGPGQEIVLGSVIGLAN